MDALACQDNEDGGGACWRNSILAASDLEKGFESVDG
jgi:hypothetical protein